MTARDLAPTDVVLARLQEIAAAAATEDEARAVAAELRAYARRARAARWQPYPWQRPHLHPPGWVSTADPRLGVCDPGCADLPTITPDVHQWWVQRGGRGTGKTDAASYYVNAHMEGPPCDPRVPGGHRMTIAGPTQADAVSSCVTGVSGVQSINPAITVSTGKEGTIVRWPNGAVGRVLGADSARDVQRARAWTNVCVAEGSLVQTALGPVPIEDVRPGDLVWTRTGLRPVLHAEATGYRPVVHVTADGAGVWVTPDHPIARPDGTFTRADSGGSVLVWQEQISDPRRSDAAVTPTAGAPTVATTTGSRASCTASSTPEEPRHGHTSSGCARCAAAGSPVSAGPAPAPAPQPAVVSPPSRHATVYDLAVEGHHEFYAGGVLVGNCLWWLEEFAAMPYAGGLAGLPGHESEQPGMLDQAPFTLRLGPHPHGVLTTTPTGRAEVGVVLDDPGNVPTWGRTRDAHHLPDVVRESLEVRYPPGTTLGRQELDGERVGDVAGAMWVQQRTDATPDTDDRPGIDNDRVPAGSIGWTPHSDVHTLTARSADGARTLAALLRLLPAPPPDDVPKVTRAAVGVDPAGGATENGISVVGTVQDHGYTLADLSLRGGPGTWGMLAVLAWQHFGTEGIALERTYGGDQTEHSIVTAAAELGLPMPALLRAPTVEGKRARAIPVQALAQVRRLHMVGVFPLLESEMTTWVEDVTPESPNRLDAWVHAHRHLLIRARTGGIASPGSGRRIPGR